VEFVDIDYSYVLKAENSKSPIRSTLSRIPGAKLLSKVKNTPSGLMELKKIGKACVDMSTSSEPVHEAVFRIANSRDPDQQFSYHRFNVEKGMESVGLEEWKANVRMGEPTAQYMRTCEGEMKRNICVPDLWKPTAVERK
jgi:hypothetical protein